jgi:hypothetical protein
MRRSLLAPLVSLSAALCLPACTQTLDFDEVSNGSKGSGYDPTKFSCAALSPPATFCDSFDGKSPAETWSALLIAPANGGGAVSGDSSFSLTPPNSLLVSVPGVATPGYTASAVQRTFGTFEGKPMDVHVEFDMKVEQVDPRAGARVLAFQFLFGLGTAVYDQLVLNLTSTGANVTSQFTQNLGGTAQGTFAGDILHAPALDKWVHVTFDLAVFNPNGAANTAGLGNNAKLKIDQETLFDAGLMFPLHMNQPRLELGIPGVDTSAGVETKPWRVRFDNFQATLTPKN